MMSLRRTLQAWLTLLLAVIGVVTAVASYILAGEEAAELFDSQLRQIALYVWDVPEGFRPDTIAAPPHDPEDDFLVQVWSHSGNTVMSSNPKIALPRAATSGFSEATASGIVWRVYTAIDPDRTVQVSQQVEVREELAADASVQAALPIALLIPLSWLVLNWIIRRIIGRLDRVAAEVAEREAVGLEPVSVDQAPAEIAPLISAMNGLVVRLKSALDQQRRFVADAAHELRSPLAAISLQAGNLAAAIGNVDKYAPRIADLQAGTARASALVSQLLRLARMESEGGPQPRQRVELLPLMMESLARFAPLAEYRSIDLGLDKQAEPAAMGARDEIQVLLDNLVDNAIRYTPQGGSVDVSIRDVAGAPTIEVCDTGPGIPAGSLPHVFTRFFRARPGETEGSGLGLAIAKAAAERNNIVLTVANRTDRSGLRATLEFSRPNGHPPA